MGSRTAATAVTAVSAAINAGAAVRASVLEASQSIQTLRNVCVVHAHCLRYYERVELCFIAYILHAQLCVSVGSDGQSATAGSTPTTAVTAPCTAIDSAVHTLEVSVRAFAACIHSATDVVVTTTAAATFLATAARTTVGAIAYNTITLTCIKDCNVSTLWHMVEVEERF
eukprot:14245-Heterococcus_DN1.PRE.8